MHIYQVVFRGFSQQVRRYHGRWRLWGAKKGNRRCYAHGSGGPAFENPVTTIRTYRSIPSVRTNFSKTVKTQMNGVTPTLYTCICVYYVYAGRDVNILLDRVEYQYSALRGLHITPSPRSLSRICTRHTRVQTTTTGGLPSYDIHLCICNPLGSNILLIDLLQWCTNQLGEGVGLSSGYISMEIALFSILETFLAEFGDHVCPRPRRHW